MLGQAEQNPSRAVEDNQARRRINLEWAGYLAWDAPRAVFSCGAERGVGIFKGRNLVRPLNVFFWFVFCHATENEHPRKNKQLNKNVKSDKKGKVKRNKENNTFLTYIPHQ